MKSASRKRPRSSARSISVQRQSVPASMRRPSMRLLCAGILPSSRGSPSPPLPILSRQRRTSAPSSRCRVLKRVAVKLSKTCNDLRLLSSGPRVGLGEINLPPMQAGSSIMPGKVNPVIPEVVNQIAFEVIGNDLTVSFAAEAGQLQLNAFEPIIAHSLFKSVNHLRAGCLTLADRCVKGISANREHLRRGVERLMGLVTALNPYIGYANATEIAQQALITGQSVYDLVLARKLLTAEQLEQILQPEVLTRPRSFGPGPAPGKTEAVVIGPTQID